MRKLSQTAELECLDDEKQAIEALGDLRDSEEDKQSAPDDNAKSYPATPVVPIAPPAVPITITITIKPLLTTLEWIDKGVSQ